MPNNTPPSLIGSVVTTQSGPGTSHTIDLSTAGQTDDQSVVLIAFNYVSDNAGGFPPSHPTFPAGWSRFTALTVTQLVTALSSDGSDAQLANGAWDFFHRPWTGASSISVTFPTAAAVAAVSWTFDKHINDGSLLAERSSVVNLGPFFDPEDTNHFSTLFYASAVQRTGFDVALLNAVDIGGLEAYPGAGPYQSFADSNSPVGGSFESPVASPPIPLSDEQVHIHMSARRHTVASSSVAADPWSWTETIPSHVNGPNGFTYLYPNSYLVSFYYTGADVVTQLVAYWGINATPPLV